MHYLVFSKIFDIPTSSPFWSIFSKKLRRATGSCHRSNLPAQISLHVVKEYMRTDITQSNAQVGGSIKIGPLKEKSGFRTRRPNIYPTINKINKQDFLQIVQCSRIGKILIRESLVEFRFAQEKN